MSKMKKKYFFEIGLLIIFLAVLSAQQTSSFVLNELNVTFPNGTANTLSFQFQGYFFNSNVSSYIMSLDNGSIVRNAPSFSQMTPVTSNSQSVNFTEIFSNVTIRYYLDGTRRVKEAIIINEKPYNTYSGDYLNIT